MLEKNVGVVAAATQRPRKQARQQIVVQTSHHGAEGSASGRRTPQHVSKRLSAAEARRIAFAAQGFGKGRPAGPPGRRQISAAIERIGLVQIDSVNVLVRSHYLPLFSRLGNYDRTLLERAAYGGRTRSLFEYWGHEASLIPISMQPLFRWRMERATRGTGTWGRISEFATTRKKYGQSILAQVRERGPLAAGDIADHKRTGTGWWSWSEVKIALEYLFWSGQITAAKRHNFERLYDVPERVFPASVLSARTPDEADAQRELVRLASRALGVATAVDLRDYFRLDAVDGNPRIAELVEAGSLIPVAVEGWKAQAYLAAGTSVPRSIEVRALLSPFDSLVWERSRDRRLFDFDYRLEIYTPAHKRVHGYYVLPFAYGDRIAARIDAKAQRARSTLDVIAVHYEDATPSIEVRDALAAEIEQLAAWLDLERVSYIR
ncbi:MAG: winged helix-turn-helix domain-containing protein [Candidatus Velthaea sp.]